MACTPKEFRDRKISEALGLIYNPDAYSYTLHPKDNPNSVVIKPSPKSKIKTMDQAFRAAESMRKKLKQKYGEPYMFNAFGHWGTIYTGVESVRVEIKIPDNLMRAYEAKQESQRNVEYFNSDTALYEQEQRELANFFDLPKEVEEQINFNAFVDYKQKMLQRTEKALLNLQSLRRHDKSKELASKIRGLDNIKTKLSQDIQSLLDSETIFEQTVAFINEDLTTLDSLLDNNNIDNLHTAEKMIGFYEEVGDYTFGSNNPLLNTKSIYDDKGKLLLEPEVKEVLDNISYEISKRKSRLNKNKESYLQELIDDSSHIQALFPEMDINQMLQDIKDIDIASQFFLTVDKQFVSQDSLLSQLMKIELERSRSKNKSFVADIKSRMDAILPDVKSKLPKVANIPYWFGKSITESDFSMFYQETGKGNKTGRIVDKFSTHWFSTFNKSMGNLNSMYFNAIKTKNWAKASETLAKKYQWLNNHTDFIDISLLPEVVNNERYAKYLTDTDTSGAEAYSNELKEKLGENYYNKVIDKQLEQLEDFESWQEDYIEAILVDQNIETFEELPDVVKYGVQVTFLRNNPFELIKSHKSRQEGRVDYIGVNDSSQFQSHVKFIEYIPKQNIKAFNLKTKQIQEVESNYYDNNFKQLEQDPDLFKFWEILEEATTFINMTLADSEKQLKHGSILSMKKSFWDILIDPKSGIGNKFINISSDVKQGIKSLFTSNSGTKNADDFDNINKGQFKTNEDEINKRVKTLNLILSRVLGEDIYKNNKKLNLEKVSQEFLNVFTKALSLPNNRQELISLLGKSISPTSVVREYVTNQVIQEQTFNLPVILRAYLEMTAEYKAQKESQPQLSVYKQFYESIKRESSNSRFDNSLVMKAINSITDSNSLKTERVRANKRLNHWYNKNITGNNDQAQWVNFGKINWLSYDKQEKDLKKELEAKLNAGGLSEEEINKIQNEIDNLGANVTLAAIYNSIINKFTIFKGLAYSVKSNVINRFQGWFQGMVYDTGKYWTAGNFMQANDFIMKKGLRYVPGNKAYKQEIEKVKLLINELNILQDATNEIDRARNEDGLTGLAKKVQPFYITEYTEWHNQVPQILSMLMDKTIKDKDGNEVAVFNGKELVAYEISDGLLKLKEEFNTPENVETWETFSNTEAADNKLYLSEVIGIINGDYSRTGSTYIKKGNLGKTAMLFKTWMPNNIWSRISSKQTNLTLGKKELDGIYTSHRPITLGTTLGTVGLLTAGLPVAVPAFAIGAGIGAVISNKQGRELEMNLKAASKIAEVGQAILKKMMGLPLNAISGKQIIKEHELGNLAVTEQDKQNLKSIINEMSVLLSFVLFKVMIKALIGDNDEDEPKTVNGKGVNPYYPGNPRSDREKMMHNILENEITRIINDITLYQNPASLYESTIQRNAIYQNFEDVKKLVGAVQKWNQGLDEIQNGPNKGESRLWNQTQRMTMPGIFQDPLTLGFGKSLEQEYDKTEFFDTYFNSDYKKDKKVNRANRSGQREKLTLELQKDYGYDKLSPAEKKIIDGMIKKQVNKAVKYSSPYPNRLEYDENQMDLN